VVAGHEVALFVGIVVHSQDAVATLLARVYHEFLTRSHMEYLLDFLSHTWIVLPSVA
jgi:hypothetical protein